METFIKLRCFIFYYKKMVRQRFGATTPKTTSVSSLATQEVPRRRTGAGIDVSRRRE